MDSIQRLVDPSLRQHDEPFYARFTHLDFEWAALLDGRNQRVKVDAPDKISSEPRT